jgi:hypothetical protein
MPTDEWRKAQARKKSAGRDCVEEVEQEKKRDALVDAWIAKKEAELAAQGQLKKPKPEKIKGYHKRKQKRRR